MTILQNFWWFWTSVVDSERFDTDADPDPTFQADADADPVPDPKFFCYWEKNIAFQIFFFSFSIVL